MYKYKNYTVGDIINNNWELLDISKKLKSGRNRVIFTVRCINCGHIDENEFYTIITRKKCKYCRESELQSMIGMRQGRLQILELSSEKHSNGSTMFICRCDCGNIFSTTYSSIKRGTSSCGCLNNEPTTLTHGMTGTRIYRIWKNMKSRCYNPNSTYYNRYGGRGIKICPEWLEDFMNFYNWAMTNGYSDDLTIERIDGDGDYCPENCRWATMMEQSNNRYNTIYINHYGEKTIRDLSTIYGEPYSVIKRHYYNNTLEQFLKSKQDEFMKEFYRQLQTNK